MPAAILERFVTINKFYPRSRTAKIKRVSDKPFYLLFCHFSFDPLSPSKSRPQETVYTSSPGKECSVNDNGYVCVVLCIKVYNIMNVKSYRLMIVWVKTLCKVILFLLVAFYSYKIYIL